MQSRKGEEKQEKSVMEKSRSYPQYSSSSNYSGEFGNFQDDQSNAYTFNGPTTKGFAPSNDPEIKRKKRIAAYNMFTTEGKVKATMRESFKWIKTKISDIRYSV